MARPKPEEEAASIKSLFRRSDIDKIDFIERFRDHAIDVLKPINKKGLNLKNFEHAATFCLYKPKAIIFRHALDLLRACTSALEYNKVDKYHIDWIVTTYHALSIKEQDNKISSKGGKKDKLCQPILIALKNYLKDDPELAGMSNNHIIKEFKEKINFEPIVVNFNNSEWEIYYSEIDKLIFADPDTNFNKKNKIVSRSITTIRKTYIPEAKKI